MCVVRTLWTSEWTQPFAFNWEAQELETGEYRPRESELILSKEEEKALIQDIRGVDPRVWGLVIGQYACPNHEGWFRATKDEWGLDTCLQCATGAVLPAYDWRFDEPYDLGEYIFNLEGDLRGDHIIETDGTVPDLKAFKHALVTRVSRSVVISRGATDPEEWPEDLCNAMDTEGPPVTEFYVYLAVTEKDAVPQNASFRENKIQLRKGETITEYLVKEIEGEVRLVGEPALSTEDEDRMFGCLAQDLARVQIFDDQPDVVADALRDMLDRR